MCVFLTSTLRVVKNGDISQSNLSKRRKSNEEALESIVPNKSSATTSYIIRTLQSENWWKGWTYAIPTFYLSRLPNLQPCKYSNHASRKKKHPDKVSLTTYRSSPGSLMNDQYRDSTSVFQCANTYCIILLHTCTYIYIYVYTAHLHNNQMCIDMFIHDCLLHSCFPFLQPAACFLASAALDAKKSSGFSDS